MATRNMKLTPLLFILGLVTALNSAVSGAENVKAGPKGGRLLTNAPQPAEFFVTPEGRAEVIFYDHALNPASLGTQIVTLFAEPPGGRKSIALEKTDHGFISQAPLPDSGATYRVVVQLRESPGAPPKNFRIDLNLETCGECQRAEYACTCDH